MADYVLVILIVALAICFICYLMYKALIKGALSNGSIKFERNGYAMRTEVLLKAIDGNEKDDSKPASPKNRQNK